VFPLINHGKVWILPGHRLVFFEVLQQVLKCVKRLEKQAGYVNYWGWQCINCFLTPAYIVQHDAKKARCTLRKINVELWITELCPTNTVIKTVFSSDCPQSHIFLHPTTDLFGRLVWLYKQNTSAFLKQWVQQKIMGLGTICAENDFSTTLSMFVK
jgi:hypothetical protein